MKQPDTKEATTRPVEKLLAFADYLEKVPPEKFSMASWCGTAACVAGHWALWEHGAIWIDETDSLRPMAWTLASEMGGSETDAAKIWSDAFLCVNGATAKDAAAMVRHFALTGEVDWSGAAAD